MILSRFVVLPVSLTLKVSPFQSSECHREAARLRDVPRPAYAGYLIAMSRSTSGGRTWSNTTFITNQADDCGHQPTAVYDAIRKQIVLQLRCGGKGSAADASSAAGAHPYQMISKTGGLTWEPRTPLWQQLPPTFQRVFPGPGIGLQLKRGQSKGRLLFCGWDMEVPSKTKEEENERDLVMYSDDGGSTYKAANASASADFKGMDECQMAELRDGRLMIMLRHDNQFAPCTGGPPSPPPPPGVRTLARCKAVAYSDDQGASWGPVSYVAALESGSDESSVLSLGDDLFYSGAADHSTTGAQGTYGRKNFTVRASTDSGRTCERLSRKPAQPPARATLPSSDCADRAAERAAVRAPRERQLRSRDEPRRLLEPQLRARPDAAWRALGGGDTEPPVDRRASLHDSAPHVVRQNGCGCGAGAFVATAEKCCFGP